MAIYINTNMGSLLAQQNLASSQASLQTSLQRLSSGLRINTAADDPAGMAIANRMTSQINGDMQAGRNANDGISLVQTANGAMQSIADNLQTMRNLAVQASNATATSSDRQTINNEIQQLSAEIQRVATSTNFNGTTLIDGSFTAQSFQVGANQGNTIAVTSIANMQTTALGASSTTSVAGTAVNGAGITTGALTLNGVQVGASVAGSLNGQSAGSAYAVANAINLVSGTSGVSAVAQATTVNGTAPAASGAITTGTFSINGVAVGAINAGGNAVGQGANVAAAINLVSSNTGVTASANATTGAVTLTAIDGRDIAITGTITNTGLTAATTHSSVTLSSNSASGITVSGGSVASAGLTAATTAATTTFTISSLDTLTASDAQQAITTITGAINQVNTAMGALGAYQNRFTSAASNLTTFGNNLSAARSRIQDTDYAAETANLSRNQILQQAGTAMLAQANSLPNGVLALLR
jgi:flagellin